MNETNLLKKYGSPLYVYNEDILKQKAENMLKFAEKLKAETGIPEIIMHYSTKANGNLYILKKLRGLGLSVDAMSPAELRLAELAGFGRKDILYVCNNISAEEMTEVIDKDIMICLDSISQLELLGQCRGVEKRNTCEEYTLRPIPDINVLIRINPETEGIGHSEKVVTSGKHAKFGVSEENIPELLSAAEKYGIKIAGIHQHLGSLFLNDKIDDYIEGVKAGLRIAKTYFKDLEIVDLGGGFGVPYKEDEEDLDLDMLAEKLSPILSEFAYEYHIAQLKFEPGRYIPCEAGYILGTVNAIKDEMGKIWIGTDIGMNVLLRPSMYDAYHKIEIIPVGAGALGDPSQYITATIVGNVCESCDILGEDRNILKPELGDIVKIYNAGAYGYCMASNYTGRPRPAEIMINKNGADVSIRKRDTVGDIVRSLKL